jgi:hypothetical protein
MWDVVNNFDALLAHTACPASGNDLGFWPAS